MAKRFLQDCRGNISILSAVMITSLIGVTGLVAEYGDGLLQRMQDQRIADAAAMAGATIYSQTSSSTAMSGAVGNVALLNGMPGASVSSELVSSPSGDGNQSVHVTVSSNAPLIFARLLQPSSQLAIQATSYAEIRPGSPGCIIALNNSGTGVTASGGTAVTTRNCSIASNQTIGCSGGASMTVDYVYYYSGAPSCSNLRNSSGGTPTEKQVHTADPLAATSEVQNQTARLATVASITSPSSVAGASGTVTSLPFASSTNAITIAALAAKGCVGVYAASVWTVTCPAGGTYQFGVISVSGGATVNFNVGGSASNTYYFSQIATGSGILNFGPGTFNVPQGIVTTNGSAVTTFGAGTFNIGASSSVSCNSANSYSICNGGPTMTFAGPSTFVLSGGIYAKSGSAVTLGSSGSSNSFNIGEASDGNSLYMGGGSTVWFGDATGSGDIFQMAGNMNDPNGGSCLNLGAATYHDINGFFLTAGGNVLGSGIYAVTDYVSLGGSNGGNVTCWGASTGVSGSNVTLVIGGSVLDSSGHAFYVGAGYSTVTLTAPTSGSTQNLAVIGPTSTSDTGTAVFTEGASNTSISGAVYFPNGAVSLSGAASVGNGSGQCLELIGSQITLSGGSALGSICTIPGAGSANGTLISLVQ